MVRGGRFFLRRILDSIKPLRQAKHKTKLNAGRKDLAWWLTFLSTFNGRQYYTERHDVHVLTFAARPAAVSGLETGTTVSSTRIGPK